MKYQTGGIGKVIVARFEDGDDVLLGLSDIAVKEEIKAAVFYLVGGLNDGKIVVGPESESLPPVPVWRRLGESHESLAIGTIFRQDNEPKIHVHGTYGKHDNVKMGCLRERAKTFLVMEAIILEIKGINAVRDLDAQSGMVLLKLLDIPLDDRWKFPDLQFP